MLAVVSPSPSPSPSPSSSLLPPSLVIPLPCRLGRARMRTATSPRHDTPLGYRLSPPRRWGSGERARTHGTRTCRANAHRRSRRRIGTCTCTWACYDPSGFACLSSARTCSGQTDVRYGERSAGGRVRQPAAAAAARQQRMRRPAARRRVLVAPASHSRDSRPLRLACRSLARSLVRSFVRSLARSFVHSLARSLADPSFSHILALSYTRRVPAI